MAYSLEQRDHALKVANTVREGNSLLKQRLRDGDLRLSEALRDPPSSIGHLMTYQVLMFGQGVGRVRASKWCKHAQIWPLRLFGDLTVRQRLDLADFVEREGK